MAVTAGTLERAYAGASGAECQFERKKILLIGSESYDAPAIAVIEGLHRLGFSVYALHKPNINSWFCNIVITDPGEHRFDFVLSNLHWGTRWSLFDRYDLHGYPKVLIDGDDNRASTRSWRDKHRFWCDRYGLEDSEEIKQRILSPYRWMEDLGAYTPDVVFTSQKRHKDNSTVYLPFGILEHYNQVLGRRPYPEKTVPVVHVPGGGVRRARMFRLLKGLRLARLLPDEWVNRPLWGPKFIDARIRHLADRDDNIHSYHRWITYGDYAETLRRAKLFIYPGIQDIPWWDSKRIWEAYSAGCLVMMSKPTVDVSEYPVTELSPFTVCRSALEVVAKCSYLSRRPALLEALRTETVRKAAKYFDSVAIARYFLWRLREHLA
jgi:hypothetical protein